MEKKELIQLFKDLKTAHELPNDNSGEYNLGYVDAMNMVINRVSELEPQHSKPSQSAEELRNKFFEECTIKKDGLRIVNMTPHNIFEWFAQQSTPTVTDEEIEKQADLESGKCCKDRDLDRLNVCKNCGRTTPKIAINTSDLDLITDLFVWAILFVFGLCFMYAAFNCN